MNSNPYRSIYVKKVYIFVAAGSYHTGLTDVFYDVKNHYIFICIPTVD